MNAATHTDPAAPSTSRRGSRHTRALFGNRYLTLQGLPLVVDATASYDTLEALDLLQMANEQVGALIVESDGVHTAVDRLGRYAADGTRLSAVTTMSTMAMHAFEQRLLAVSDLLTVTLRLLREEAAEG